MLEVGSWMLDVPFSPLAVRGSQFASGVRHPSDMRDFHAFAASCPSVVSLAYFAKPETRPRVSKLSTVRLWRVSGECPGRLR